MVPLGSSYHPDLKILTVSIPQNFLKLKPQVYITTIKREIGTISK